MMTQRFLDLDTKVDCGAPESLISKVYAETPTLSIVCISIKLLRSTPAE